MKKLNHLVMATLIIMLIACDKMPGTAPSSAQPGNADFGVTKAELDAFLRLNKIPEQDGKRRDRVVESYIERNALAEVISNQQWKDRSITDVQIKDKRNQLLINNYFSQQIQPLSSDAAIQQYYEANKTNFEKRKLHLANIFIRASRAQQTDPKSERATLVTQIVEKLKSGADFAELAKKHSMDSSTAEKGGDLDWISNEDGKNIFFQMAENLKVGEVSKPVVTDRGVYIVKLLEEPVVETIPYEEIKDKVIYQYNYDMKLKEMKRLKQLAKARVEMETKKFTSN